MQKTLNRQNSAASARHGENATEDQAVLPKITFVVEWENAIDVEDQWVSTAAQALAKELEDCAPRFVERPALLYLFNDKIVSEREIRAFLKDHAPGIESHCDLSFVVAPDLTYYKLKNYGAQLAKTDIVAFVDSDAAPQPGWVEAILAPFRDDKIQFVAGFTTLAHCDLLSRTMALIWIFELPSEKEKTRKKNAIHANNCAFRRDFFLSNPWPELPAFKKQCTFWLKRINEAGVPWVRTSDAMARHAPHPGVGFLVRRAWISGRDRDALQVQISSARRGKRVAYSFKTYRKKLKRAWSRIIGKHQEVDLPHFQVPAALFLATGYVSILFASELLSALFRSYEAVSYSPVFPLQEQAPNR